MGGACEGRAGVIGSAAFLACSWTWVIGMYLPVILVREFGWAGWAAFAVPNVVGAAGMGLVLRRAGSSEAMLEGHTRAASMFSAATIAFHAFFITWACGFVFDGFLGRFAGVAGAAVMAAVGLALARLGSRGWGAAGIGWWVMSVALLGLALWTGGGHAEAPRSSGQSAWTGLLFLAPVCVFGFALCPYLDLTFHRVRREAAGRTGSAAFVLGFGGLFLVMIAGTLVYAQGMISNRWWSYYVVAHLVMQSGFTVGAHARERAALARVGRGEGVLYGLLTPLLLGVALGLVPGVMLRPRFEGGELIYVLFMALYGLVFPAYVWVAMARRGAVRRGPMLWWALGVGVAGPMFWMGFVEREWWWLGPGLLVVLMARLGAVRGVRGAA